MKDNPEVAKEIEQKLRAKQSGDMMPIEKDDKDEEEERDQLELLLPV